MDNTSEYVLKVVANHPYYILAAGLLAAIYYTSLPQAPIYGSFDRAGTTLTWKAVHKVVQGGYDKVQLPPSKLLLECSSDKNRR
jgi:hypothetical protein